MCIGVDGTGAEKTTIAFLKLFYVFLHIFISAMQFAECKREAKKNNFGFLKMIMHNLSICYNYLCDSMQFSNAFEVEICELCFVAEMQKKMDCVCVFFSIR